MALADTDNPTLKNENCTVCHQILDPVVGAFQNYGDEGLYRDKFGGLGSLPDSYRYIQEGQTHLYQEGDSWYRDMLAPGLGEDLVSDASNSLQWLAASIAADERFALATVEFWWAAISYQLLWTPGNPGWRPGPPMHSPATHCATGVRISCFLMAWWSLLL